MVRMHGKNWGWWFVAGFCCLVGISGVGFSEEVGRGGYAGSFLRMGLGARAMGMGGGSVALTDDGYTTYYNPAGLVFLGQRWFTATLNSMALDRRLFYVGYAQSVGGGDRRLVRGGFSVGWLCAGVDRIDARDFNGNDTGSLSNWEHCFYFSFALNPVPPLAIGFSGKLLYNRFPGITDEEETVSAVGFGFDVGFILKPVRWMTLGFAVRDLRSKYTWDTQKLWERGTQTVDAFPKIMRVGVALTTFSDRVVFSFDSEKVEYWPWRFGVGVELEGYKGLFLRGGVKGKDLVCGAGYVLSVSGKSIRLDYAYVPDHVAPRSSHVFTWSFIF